jgi:hypothetical protein
VGGYTNTNETRRKKIPFTHWMIYGQPKEGMNPDTAPKAWAEFKEALKGVNLKMAGPWGPFGVPEGISFMLKGKNMLTSKNMLALMCFRNAQLRSHELSHNKRCLGLSN